MSPLPFSGRRCRLVVGLPGSGKTRYARGLGPGWTVVDDPERPADLPADFPGDVVITSPHFCQAESLAFAEAEVKRRWPGIAVETAFFANDPEACRKNAARRPGKDVDGLIVFLSRRYAPPAGTMPVWRAAQRQTAFGGPPAAG